MQLKTYPLNYRIYARPQVYVLLCSEHYFFFFFCTYSNMTFPEVYSMNKIMTKVRLFIACEYFMSKNRKKILDTHVI